MPDFGYEYDNYLLADNKSKSNWQTLLSLLKNTHRFKWLLNYINLAKLESAIQVQTQKQ